MRDLVGKTRLRPGQEPTDDMLVRTYNTSLSLAAEELIERWSAGKSPPVPDGRLEVVKAMGPDGRVVGFNVYLVWAEPRHLGGPMPEEPA